MSDVPLKLDKIALVLLGVKDLAKSVEFYRDKLGMTVQGESPGFAFLAGGGITLSLSEPLAKNSPQMVGATEVVFAVDKVTAAYQALRARGVRFLNEPRVVVGENWGVNFTDPDGHRLSLFGSQ